GTNRAEILQPMVSGSPTAEPSPGEQTPSPEPSPTQVTPSPDGPPWDDSADGIPDGAYPALAADRNATLVANPEMSYPQAHVMEDWVWDRVGPTWGVGIASQLFYPPAGLELPPAVLYLHSPDGVYFEVAELPEEAWDDARVVSWQEDARTLRVWTRDGGGLFDMTTGEFDPIEFSIGGEPAPLETFVAANALGDELWFAENDNGGGFYRWSASAGWAKASLWDVAPAARHFGDAPGYSEPNLSVDGDAVLLAIAPTTDDGLEGVPTSFVEYRLSRDTTAVFDAGLPANALSVYAVTWVDERSVSLEVELPDGYRPALVELGGQTRIDPQNIAAAKELAALPEWVDVEFREATRRETAGMACGC
ncbi:MAG: hypothetical protein ACK4MD_05045, partial [Demequina sp.]